MLTENPWLSFRQYKEDDASRFKGRDEDIDHLYRLVTRSDLSVIYAESGIGKSSLINAGLIPSLRANMYLPLSFVLTRDKIEGDAKAWFSRSIMTQITGEIERLNAGLAADQHYRWESVLPEDVQSLLEPLMDDSLWWFLRTHQLVSMGLDVTPVLIFDQFEEVLKLEDASLTEGFFSLCQDLSREDIPQELKCRLERVPEMADRLQVAEYHILLSQREEYIGQLDYWSQQRFSIPSLKNNRYCLRPLTPSQAEDIITRQGVDTLNGVKGLVIDQAKETGKDSISTLILSVLCHKLYNMAQTAPDGSKLPLSAADMPESTNALIGDYYDEQLGQLRDDQGRPLRISTRARRLMEGALLSASGSRLRVPVDIPSLSRMGFREKYMCALDKANLVRLMEINGEQYVELVHDRVAEMIHERRRAIAAKKSRKISYAVILFAVVGLILVLNYFFVRTSDQKLNREHPYLELVGNHVSSGGDLIGRQDLQQLVLQDPLIATIKDCYRLETISISFSENAKGKLDLLIENCPRLRRIEFADGLEIIEHLSVSGCPRLEPVRIPSTLMVIEKDALSDFDGEIIPDEGKTKYMSLDGSLWEKDDNSYYLMHVREASKRDYVVFPKGAFVKDSTFNGKLFKDSRQCPYDIGIDTLEGFRFSADSILDFRKEPFNEVKYVNARLSDVPLRKVILSNRVLSIKGEFTQCRDLRKIVFPDSSSLEVGENAFNGCENLDTLVFGTRLKSINQKALLFHKRLDYVVLPDTVDVVFYNQGMLLPHFRAEVQAKSQFCKEAGIVFYNGQPFSSETDYHTYCASDSSYFSCQGVLCKKEKDSISFIDCPASADILACFREITGYTLYAGDNIYAIGGWRNSCFYIKRGASQIVDVGDPPLKVTLFLNDIAVGPADTKVRQPRYSLQPGWNGINYFWPAFFANNPEDLSGISDIHTLAIRPDYLINGESNPALRISTVFPEEYKKRITLHVPHGSREYYIDHPAYQSYHEIVEDSVLYRYVHTAKYVFLSSIPWLVKNRAIVYPLLGLGLLLLLLFVIYKIRTAKGFWVTFLFFTLGLVLGFAVWFFLYWILYNCGLSILVSNIIAVFAGVVIFVLVADRRFNVINGLVRFWHWCRDAWKNRRELAYRLVIFLQKSLRWVASHKFIFMSVLLGLLIALGLAIRHSRYNALLQQAQELIDKNQYKEAAQKARRLLPSQRGIKKNRQREVEAARIYQIAVLNLSEKGIYPFVFADFRHIDKTQVNYAKNSDLGAALYKGNMNYLCPSSDYSPSDIKASPDGRWLIGPVKYRSFSFMDLSDGSRVIDTLYNYNGKFIFSPDGRWLINRIDYNHISLLDLSEEGKVTDRLVIYYNCEFSPDGRWLMRQISSDECVLSDLNNRGIEVDTLHSHQGKFLFSPDSRWLINRIDNDYISLLDLSEGAIVKDTLYNNSYYSCKFSPDGRWLMYKTEQDKYLLSDLSNGGSAVDTLDCSRYGDSCEFSPDGQWLMYRISMRECSLQNLSNGVRFVATLGNCDGAFTFSPDGRWLLNRTQEDQLSVLDLSKNAKEVVTLNNHDGGFDFSPDGRWMISRTGVSKSIIMHFDGREWKTWTELDFYPERGAIDWDSGLYYDKGRKVLFFLAPTKEEIEALDAALLESGGDANALDVKVHP